MADTGRSPARGRRPKPRSAAEAARRTTPRSGASGPPAPGDTVPLSPGGHIAPAVGTLVRQLSEKLARAGIENARQEARDMVAAVLDKPRFWPTANADTPLDPAKYGPLMSAAERRAAGAPFAYAVGRAAFRHLTLVVDERVLIPRVETEQLVDLVLAAGGAGGTVVDVGTGSGAIACALATEGAFERVIATDVSLDALAVAACNIERTASASDARLELRHGAGLAPVAGLTARVVVCNPPYIAYSEAAALPPSVRAWEPAVALLSGDEGLAVTATIIRDTACVLEPGGLLALEVDTRRAARVADMAVLDGRYGDVRVHRDLTHRDRFVTARRI